MKKVLQLDSPIVASSGGQAPGLGSGGRRLVTALCAALVTLGLAQAAGAAPGDLDLSFDADGRVLTHFGAIDGDASGRSDFATVAAAQPDGKLVVAGGSDAAGFGSSDVALARYNADGSLDASFGSGGHVLTDFVGSPDGFASTGDFALARYNADGSLDVGFGSGGASSPTSTDDSTALRPWSCSVSMSLSSSQTAS